MTAIAQEGGMPAMSRHRSVSVCVPVYNGERHLQQALDSILGQTRRDFELVVVDNASTDRTGEILASYMDPRLVTIRNERNIGPVGNFNRCLELARCDYVKIVCADDVLLPTCLERQMDVVARVGEGVSMVCAGRNIIDADGHVWMTRRYGGRAGRVKGRVALRKAARCGTNLFGEPAAVLMKSEEARRAGGFREGFRFCLDLDLWCRLLLDGDLYAIPEPLCGFRVSPGAWSVTIGQSQSREYSDFIAAMARDGRYGLTSYDQLAGKAMGRVNSFLRLVFYRLVFSRSVRTKHREAGDGGRAA